LTTSTENAVLTNWRSPQRKTCPSTEARCFYRDYQEGNLSPSALAAVRPQLEARLAEVVGSPTTGGFPFSRPDV
jgi:hypothetical protein